MAVLWHVKYKSPLSPSRGVWDCYIETTSEDPARAELVARDYLARFVAHPSTHLMLVERAVVHTEDAMIKFREQGQPQPVADPKAPPAGASAGRGGRIGG